MTHSAAMTSKPRRSSDATTGKRATNAATSLWLAVLLLGASGFSSLVFQVVWIRQLSTVVGVDVYAVSAGISAFMGGLALGGFIFGRLSDRLARPLRLYGLLEVAVAALGVLITLGLPHFAAPFARLEDTSAILAWSLLLIAVAPPAIFMGGTLPAMLCAVKGKGSAAALAGKLYAANTLGAIAGTLATSFALIPTLGLSGTAIAAASCSAVAAIKIQRVVLDSTRRG